MSLTGPKWVAEAGVYISLGSNLGYLDLSPRAVLDAAMKRLEAGNDKIIAASSFWKSDAWPADAGAPNFINAVCKIVPSDSDTSQLLARLHEIEAEFGRLRDPQNRWSARTLDLDLLDYNGFISENNSSVILPHPRIADRDFVLRPLLQVCSNWVHPITGESAQSLLFRLEKTLKLNNCEQIGACKL
jgi:2-amino-4-hydroxy-6-hydroxymethyldihydropteridine diphosphokinase